MERDSRLTLKICLDFVLLLVVGLTVLSFYIWGEPYKRGFFCDDESIRHPFHKSTISNYMLYILGFGLPIFVILTTEYIHSITSDNSAVPRRVVCGREIPEFVWKAYIAIGIFGFGAACSQTLTDIGKYAVGRLRPHFYEICQPSVDCNISEKYKYIVDYECTGPNYTKDARLSFPSGHSSFMTYAMVYAVLYMQARFKWSGSVLLRHFLQFVCLALAAYTCVSRVSDYKHHPTDVLAGCILGALVALVVANYVLKLFVNKRNDGQCSMGYDSETEMPRRNGTTANSV